MESWEPISEKIKLHVIMEPKKFGIGNTIGITQAEETSPGIFIGSCLIKFVCSVSLLNTTESETEIQVPQIIIEEIATDAFAEAFPINPIEAEDIGESFLAKKNKKPPAYKSFKSRKKESFIKYLHKIRMMSFT